jgi:hypothetical protein
MQLLAPMLGVLHLEIRSLPYIISCNLNSPYTLYVAAAVFRGPNAATSKVWGSRSLSGGLLAGKKQFGTVRCNGSGSS